MRSNTEAQQANEQIRSGARERLLEYREPEAQNDETAGPDNGAETIADRKKAHELPDDDFGR